MRDSLTVDKFDDWKKHGGGSRYQLSSPDGAIVLSYNIEGFGFYGHAANRTSTRPWQAQVGRKVLRDAAGRARVFSSKETARKAAEKEISIEA